MIRIKHNVKEYFTAKEDAIKIGLARGMKEVAKHGLSVSESEVPVRTGNLKSSIEATIMKDAVKLEAKADYAAFVEFGTRYMAPQPFMRPSVESIDRNLEDLILDSVVKAWESS